MMEVTAKMVSDLRKRTGAGIMDCKKALAEKNGDIEASLIHLREQGLKASEMKSNRDASEGLIISYIHSGSKIGSLLEINCETDFVARTEQFNELARNIAMQVAASKPKYLSKEDVSTEDLDTEKAILKQQLIDSNKPENIIDKIIEGRLSKYYSEVCLLEQTYIRNGDKTVQDLIQEAISQLGENIIIRRFELFILGQ
ncbi:translation elongation factor Ts [Candidatus Poribacteria bacterium]|nr:translation elongation factor Ts [Candidatus Poribacteria bacterium]